MFDKPKQSKIKINSNGIDLNINAMPTDFYGGKDPVVKFKTEKKEINLNKYKITQPTTAEKKDFDKKQLESSMKSTHLVNILTKPKFLFFIASVIFVIALVSGGIYFWLTARNDKKNNKIPVIYTSSSTINATTNTSTTSVITSSTSNNSQSVTSTSLLVDTIDFPSILLGYGQDYDGDKLFDAEEILFGSDPSIIDSDGDGHLDGHEVYYLYNPIAVEPNRLIDSGKVSEYTNPTYHYKIYYLKSWTYGSIDSQNTQVLFSSANGESVEIRTFDLTTSGDFNTWFSRYAPKEHMSDLVDFESVFTQKGKMRNDKLVYYFEDDNNVYLILYHAGSKNQVHYRQVIEMMARSFRTASNNYVKQWSTSKSASSTISISSSTALVASSTVLDSTVISSTSTTSTE